MYHAVMEEVSRFLERYQTQKQQQRLNYNNNMEQQQMSRSKSLYQVYGGAAAAAGSQEKSNHHHHQPSLSGDNNNMQQHNNNEISYLRARSSTNLIDLNANKSATTTLPAAMTIDNNSYSAFKDFTWRRSPKKTMNGMMNGAHAAGLDDVEEKLCQEAFRLSRTIQNLLDTSTKQPDLTQHRNSLNMARIANKVTESNDCENASDAQDALRNLGKIILPKSNKNSQATVADMLFMRSNTMRDSRLSVRSSTDSSVHSTTSSTSSCASATSSSCTSTSKLDTDEDTMVLGMNQQISIAPIAVNGSVGTGGGSTTEDESGFSSINSFQDVGVPAFSSTLIERKNSLKVVPMRTKSITQTKHPNNILGLPDTTPTKHVWEVPAITTKTTFNNANKYHRFSTLSTEEAGTVLWV